jgi:H+/gluconate symporter-like permease
MGPEVIGVFIPIITVIVVGLAFITAIYFRSKERQMLIDKGLTAEQMKEFYERKKNPFILSQLGIIFIFFGLGLGIGIYLEQTFEGGFWVPLFLFTITGACLIAANIIRYQLEKSNKSNEVWQKS